jgi:hypothetical protein
MGTAAPQQDMDFDMEKVAPFWTWILTWILLWIFHVTVKFMYEVLRTVLYLKPRANLHGIHLHGYRGKYNHFAT